MIGDYETLDEEDLERQAQDYYEWEELREKWLEQDDLLTGWNYDYYPDGQG